MFNLDFIETTPRIKKLKSKVLVSTIIRLKSLSVAHALQNMTKQIEAVVCTLCQSFSSNDRAATAMARKFLELKTDSKKRRADEAGFKCEHLKNTNFDM